MPHDHSDLDKLFAPPEKLYGTHMLVCGLSADTETLEHMVATFTGESPAERAATGLVRSLLMLDASAPPLLPHSVPGMLQLEHCELIRWTRQTTMMHAKVALLGFAEAKFAAPTCFRLVVSTGNWTRETWGSGAQIDMFWSTDFSFDDMAAPDENRGDMAAALAFFDRMSHALYPHSMAALARQPLATVWLENWRRLLVPRRKDGPPRFMHSLDKSLFAQIDAAFPEDGAKTLVVGSAFWEQASGNTGEKPAVLKKLDELDVRGERYLVVNAGQAGALAPWLAGHPKRTDKGKIDGWTPCMPRDPLSNKPGNGRNFLHAKYIAALTRVTQEDRGTLSFLYLGSGNLSRTGLLSNAALGQQAEGSKRAGNVEAGVILLERQNVDRVWQALACGDELAKEAFKTLAPGDGEPLRPLRPPSPVVLARIEKQVLFLVRGSDEPASLEVQLDTFSTWIVVASDADSVPLPAGAQPPFIRVRLPVSGTAISTIHEVAVLAEDGTCCRRVPNEVGIDSVLDALLAFPAAPPNLPDPDLPDANTQARTATVLAARYPLKLLATLIEAIAQRNGTLTKEQFPVWLSQLRFLLLEQVSAADRAAIVAADINLFPALKEPGFVPPWFEPGSPLELAYRQLIDEIERAWTSPSAAVCPTIFTQPVAKGMSNDEAA